MDKNEYDSNLQLLHSALGILTEILDKTFFPPDKSISYKKMTNALDQVIEATTPIGMQFRDAILSCYYSLDQTVPIAEKLYSDISKSLTPAVLTALLDSLKIIKVHNNYVDFPEELIPDSYVFEEETDTQTDIPQTIKTKKLTFSDALAILSLFITVLLWVITSIQSQQDQDKQNQLLQDQLNSVKEQTTYLISIYNELQASSEVINTEKQNNASSQSNHDNIATDSQASSKEDSIN